jgi:hypothetical protein
VKWNWGNFFGKLTSRKFWVWLAVTVIAHRALEQDGGHEWITAVVVVWGVISIMYLCGEVVIDALGKAIEKAEITLRMGGGK